MVASSTSTNPILDVKQSTTMPDKPAPRNGSAVRGASLLIILQVLSRATTFTANQVLLRFLTAQLLGVSVQLEVFYLSVLFFARESLRVAIQRQGTDDDENKKKKDEKNKGNNGKDGNESAQAVVNIAHLALPLGLISALGLGWAYQRYVDTATAATPYLTTSLQIYGLAAIVELLSEPAFVVLQHRLRFGPRAAAESTATLLRCLVTFFVASWSSTRTQAVDLGVLPFALGQLSYGVGLLLVYAYYGFSLAYQENFSMFPRRPSSSSSSFHPSKYILSLFYRPTLTLASTLTAQSLLKHLLTQGDTFLVSIFSDGRSQGIYALANNYGSLLARLVFQPIEESSRNYFSKLLSSPSSSSSHPPEKQKREAKKSLHQILKAYLLLSLPIILFGPPAAPLLIQLVAGSRWSSSGAGQVLSKYCLYLPLLAFNGVLEAFVASVADKGQLSRQSAWMAGFSVVFGVVGFLTMKWGEMGAEGLVLANAVNMGCRILWCGGFVGGYFASSEGKEKREIGKEGEGKGKAEEEDGFGWSAILPEMPAVQVAGAAAVWAGLRNCGLEGPSTTTRGVFRDLLVVAAFAVPYLGMIAYTERRYLQQCYRSIRG